MNDDVTITTLVENSVNVADLRAEHGLSFLIRSGGKALLFDTGQSDLLVHNARRMGLVLEKVGAVVLSHGHYDHTGGLKAICQAAPQARLYVHPAALAQKFAANSDGTSRLIGVPLSSVELLRRPERTIVWTTKPAEVLPGFFVTGEIPRTNVFEDTGGRFFLDCDCTRPDPLIDDQALYFDTDRGVVVVLGCAHAGVVNTMAWVRDLTRNRPFHAVIGGMHLVNAAPERMRATIAALRCWEPKHIVLGHCTGISAIGQLRIAFPGGCSSCSVGTSLFFRK